MALASDEFAMKTDNLLIYLNNLLNDVQMPNYEWRLHNHLIVGLGSSSCGVNQCSKILLRSDQVHHTTIPHATNECEQMFTHLTLSVDPLEA